MRNTRNTTAKAQWTMAMGLLMLFRLSTTGIAETPAILAAAATAPAPAPAVPAVPVTPPVPPPVRTFQIVTFWPGAIIQARVTSESVFWLDLETLLRKGRFTAAAEEDIPAAQRPPAEGRQYAILVVKLREKRSIGKYDFNMDLYGLRNLVARWFFMTTLTARYSASPETTMESDLARLRSITDAVSFVKNFDQVISDTLTEDFWAITLPNEIATSSPRSPSLFAYYAALNLLGARVLFSKMKVSELLDPAIKGKKSGTERHHLFPKNYLKKMNITEIRDTNQIANYALVEWSDNIEISDSSPQEYLPQYIARFNPDELKGMYYWHALPDGWENMSYEDFLKARRKAIAQIIREAYRRLSGKRSEDDAP